MDWIWWEVNHEVFHCMMMRDGELKRIIGAQDI